MKYYSFFLCALIVNVYYILGATSFPDYLNYVTISINSGYLFTEDEYFAEWISRAWLANMGLILGDHYLSVDIFTIIIQFIYIGWIVFEREKNKLLAKFWITVFLGPLLLTTTVRATISYVCLFELFCGKLTIRRIIVLGLIAISFHDSAFIPFGIILIYSILAKIIRYELKWFIYSTCWMLVMIGPLILHSLLNLVALIGIGIRDIYFVNYVPPSTFKYLYLMFILTISYMVAKNCVDKPKVESYMLLVGAGTLMFVLASTPAIRLYLYAFGAALIIFSEKESGIKNYMKNKIIIISSPLLILGLSFFDLFRNVEV